MDNKNKARNRLSCDRQAAWLLVIIMLCFVMSGCTYVYYKHFVTRGKDTDHYATIDFKDLSLHWFIEAKYKTKRKPILTDSFKVAMAYTTHDTAVTDNERIHKFFKLIFLKIELVGEDISYEFDEPVSDTLIHQGKKDRRNMEFGEVYIPDRVDSLLVSISYSYQNKKGETQLVDTTGIYFRRADGRYSVPLGFLLD